MTANNIDKIIERIAQDIKEAKVKKNKIPEYLSKGNEGYRVAITAVRRSGYWGIVIAAIYVLFSILTIFTLAMNVSAVKGQIDPDRMTFAIILSGVLLALSIALRICMGKLYKLSISPKKVKKYLIINIVANLLPIVIGLIGGNIVIPGVIALLSIGFSVSGLSNFATYQEWFEQYGKTTKDAHGDKNVDKKHVNKKVSKQESAESQLDDYDDGL